MEKDKINFAIIDNGRNLNFAIIENGRVVSYHDSSERAFKAADGMQLRNYTIVLIKLLYTIEDGKTSLEKEE